MLEYYHQILSLLRINTLLATFPVLEYCFLGFVALMGLMTCFTGYELKTGWFGIFCAVGGMSIGGFLYNAFGLNLYVAVAIGLICVALLGLTQRIASAALVFGLTFYLLFSWAGLHHWAILIPCAVLGAVTLFKELWALPAVTAVFGSVVFLTYLSGLVPLMEAVFASAGKYVAMLSPRAPLGIAIVVVLSALGMLHQYTQIRREGVKTTNIED